MKRYTYILFDLDGTLTDPMVGITSCVKYALESFGIRVNSLEELIKFIGPPLKESFMKYYGLDDEQGEAAVEKYRERFAPIGIFENEVYPGIKEMLSGLQKRGFHLAVASSKPTVYVKRILEHFELDSYFEEVMGSELDGRRVDKSEVIEEVLKNMHIEDRTQVVMVGDRLHDIQGGKKAHLDTIGAAYGYGGREELKEAKADYIVDTVEELKNLL